MSDEAREISESLVAHMRRWAGDCPCTTADHEVCGKWAEAVAAALREAEIRGARKALERAADHTEDLFDLCGPFPARKTLSDLADSIRALDPDEVTR